MSVSPFTTPTSGFRSIRSRLPGTVLESLTQPLLPPWVPACLLPPRSVAAVAQTEVASGCWVQGQLSSSARMMARVAPHTPHGGRPSRRPQCPPPCRPRSACVLAPALRALPGPALSSLPKPLLCHEPPPAELSPRADPQAKFRLPRRLSSAQTSLLTAGSLSKQRFQPEAREPR